MSVTLNKIRLSMSDDSDLVVITAKQGDNLSNVLPIELYNDQEIVNLSGYTAAFNCIKSDKSVVLYNSADNKYLTISGNTINLTLTSTLLAVKGTCECEISLYRNNEIWSTYNFNIYVYKSPSALENYSESDLNTIKDAVSDMKQLADSAKKSEENAKTSEINAKASETASAESEANAKASEINAKNSENVAITKANEANQSAANASDSAAIAANKAKESSDSASLSKSYKEQSSKSASDASASADTAAQKANEASVSETNAKNYATKAESFAQGGTRTRPGEDTDNAKYHSEQAGTSASSASASANTASTKASQAAASAANAANSATTATNKASAASTSAANAAASADTAGTKASEAAESATQSKNYAIGSTNSAKYYYEQAKSISESFAGALRPMGTVAFAGLPSLSAAAEGDMYNVSDQFVTTSGFKEGAGNTIPAGANVYKTSDGYWDVLAGTPVTSVNGQRGNVNITPSSIGLGNVENKSSAAVRSEITKENVITALGYTPPSSDTNTWRPLGTGANDACAGNDSRLSNARPASDVYSWAKQVTKPSYSWNEINNKPSSYPPAAHEHTYLPLSGGILSGSLTINNKITCKSDAVFSGQTIVKFLAPETAGVSDIAIRTSPFNNVYAKGYDIVQPEKGRSHKISASDGWLVFFNDANEGVTVRSTKNINELRPITASAFNVASSRLVKQNIRPMDSIEAVKLLEVEVVDFDYKKQYGGQAGQHGIIAEDVANIIPAAVNMPEDFDGVINEDCTNIPTVDYAKFVPYLIKMVQIQQKEIDELKAQAADLAEKIK